jgi:hypothetical protein
MAELAAKLVELGFAEDIAKQALRATNYNPDMAAVMLLEGGASAPGGGGGGAAPAGGAYAGGGGGGAGGSLHFGPLQSAYDELSEDEKSAVRRLCGAGANPTDVLQFYMACDKNEEMTRSLL